MMFSSSQFDGFVPSQSTQTADSASPNPSKSWGTQGLIPVTVKQLSEAHQSGDEKSNFSIDGVDVTNVTLVGMVSEKTERVTDVSFALDDGTGRVECRRWLNESSDTKEMEEIHDGLYVRLVGHLRSSQGKKQLVAFAVRPVTNFDEVTFHFIDCIHQHLQKCRVKGDANAHSQMEDFSTSTPMRNISNGSQVAPTNEISGQLSVDGLKGSDQKVLEFLQQNYAQEKGVHRDEIAQQLKIPVNKIMESIRTLEEEGLIYSTIDEYHYKSTTDA
ncbi:replication protein A 32 kDa subunit A-like isoform X2 [Rhodamnia argentea]|uniref:Replication protein A 32 kDa subunit A-like isoform X2 n=1 Tax=Rhodamnia argentea TaxID=178133 RepID=A0A8B8Q478_9MYRT|nr:replication protein A 32 kDa subunit A-like isoform X2 [Rhodamnia argentea]